MRALLIICMLCTSSPVLAQSSVESFYKGRTVELVVGTLPGGGYDLYGRLDRALHRQAHPRPSHRDREEHAGRRTSSPGQLALQRRAARRHRHRHHAAVDRDRAGARHRRHPVRRRALHLYRPRRAGGGGHLHLAHLEDQIDRGRAHARDHHGRLRPGLADGVLPQGAQRARRHEIPRGRGFSRRVGDRACRAARRGRGRHQGLGLDEGRQRAVAARQAGADHPAIRDGACARPARRADDGRARPRRRAPPRR